jgi:hypothetical protein
LVSAHIFGGGGLATPSSPGARKRKMYTNLVHYLMHFMVGNWVKIFVIFCLVMGIRWGGEGFF